MVKSLFQQALDFVGDNQKIFKLDSITALPCHVQEKFLPYLSAHDLYFLSEQQSHNLNALILDQIWNLHVQRRWSRAQIVMNIFHEAGLNENAKLVYLQKYFLEILSYCSINLNTVDPISLFHCPLHKMNRPWPSDAVVKDPNDLTLHKQDLMKYSKYAETLTIIGTQCSWICGNIHILNALKNVTKIVQIQAVNDKYYDSIKHLLHTLINQGKVTHAVFSMVKLNRDNLSDLMQICAGIHYENRNEIAEKTRRQNEQIENATFDSFDRSEHELGKDLPSTSYNIPDVNFDTKETVQIVNKPDYYPELDQYYEDLEIGMDNTYKPDTSNETDTSYEIDLFDEAVTPIPSKDPSISREFYCPDGSYICLKGVKTFAMLNTNSHCKEDFGNVLIEVLPHWTSLTKFAIFDTDAESEEMVNHIVKKLEDHQLTHLVIDDANLHQTFFERLLNTFRTHYRISNTKNMSHRPLELLDFQACLKSLSAGDPVPFEGPICGIQRLDLSMTTILDSGFSLLLEHLKNDTALKHLKLNGCFLREDQVLKLLSILSEKCQLETLGLSGNKVREDEVESELIKFMANNKRLQTLILNYSRLRCQFVDSDIFMETVLTHPSLRELSVKNNHLKETVCRLLKRVCCAKNPCYLRSLNIGYNWVKGAELVETAQEIIAFRKSHQMFGPVLDFLCLSGNRLHLSDSSQSRLWNVFDGLVKDLEVDRIDYNRPFDEHLAQM
ncbi:uncharacterized protein LOC127727211 isoform X1 [Mytilus californianus]|uniref:uncharacterized protein LOC127727211 isoform X1 n=1 Tax=Mytilus californianus TaxID=6549 RepID=UPI002246659E|nr:uncharacterized protein LOC127727211 isoform X1 [Mytilus californianus]